MSQQVIVVFKDKRSREIKTYVNLDGHGAQATVEDFISLIAELYGSPVSTLTKAGFQKRLLQASEQAIRHLKAQTKEVAAVNLEPKITKPE